MIFGRVPVLRDENCHGLGKREGRGKRREKRKKEEKGRTDVLSTERCARLGCY